MVQYGLDYGAFPPEINSARMYAGAGSAPMLAAASAWNLLGAELRSAAVAYQLVVSRLVGDEWSGPASVSMSAAVAPFLQWISNTAVLAEQTAGLAVAATGAYATAYSATVPPAVVTANRAQLAALVATNLLGQNTPAIAANEAHYAQMWAQDATAMYGYAGASAAATQLNPFTAPVPGAQTQPGAGAGQGASTGSGVQASLSQMISTLPGSLQGLSSPLQSASSGAVTPTPALGLQPGDLSNAMTNLMSSSMSPMGVAGITQVGADAAVMHALSLGGLGVPEPDEVAALVPLAPGAGISAVTPANLMSASMGVRPISSGMGPVSAAVGRATLVGSLSAPQTWAAAAPATGPVSTALPGMSSSGAPAGGMPGFPGAPGAGLFGAGRGDAAPKYGFRLTVMARPPAAG